MDAILPTNCRTVYRERIIHVTQRSPAHPKLAQLIAVQSVGCRATQTHLKHTWYTLGTRAGKEVTFRVTTHG